MKKVSKTKVITTIKSISSIHYFEEKQNEISKECTITIKGFRLEKDMKKEKDNNHDLKEIIAQGFNSIRLEFKFEIQELKKRNCNWDSRG